MWYKLQVGIRPNTYCLVWGKKSWYNVTLIQNQNTQYECARFLQNLSRSSLIYKCFRSISTLHTGLKDIHIEGMYWFGNTSMTLNIHQMFAIKFDWKIVDVFCGCGEADCLFSYKLPFYCASNFVNHRISSLISHWCMTMTGFSIRFNVSYRFFFIIPTIFDC